MTAVSGVIVLVAARLEGSNWNVLIGGEKLLALDARLPQKHTSPPRPRSPRHDNDDAQHRNRLRTS